MILYCTKKLADMLPSPVEVIPNEESFFNWTANLVRFGRKSFLILSNSQTKYPVIYAGLTKPQIKNLDVIIKSTIAEHLAYERVSPKIIRKYLDELQSIRYAKLSDRKWISTLIGWNQRIDSFFERNNGEKESCHEMTGIICDDLVKYAGKNDYRVPIDEMLRELKSFANQNIFSLRAAKYRFKIKNSKGEVVRTLTVPLPLSFGIFNKIIAISFGWFENTPYFFTLTDKKTMELFHILPFKSDIANELYDNEVQLTDFNPDDYEIDYMRGDDQITKVEIKFLGMMDGFNMNRPLYEFGQGIASPDGMDPDFYDDFKSGDLDAVKKDLPIETLEWIFARVEMAKHWSQPIVINRYLERVIQRNPGSYYEK